MSRNHDIMRRRSKIVQHGGLSLSGLAGMAGNLLANPMVQGLAGQLLQTGLNAASSKLQGNGMVLAGRGLKLAGKGRKKAHKKRH